MISIVPYLAFAFLLSFDSSHAYQLGAYIWLFASYVHISNTFGLLSFYNWSLMVPAFGTAFLLFRNSADMTLTQSTTTDWAVVSVMMGGYIYNTIGTLSNNKDTETALSRARAEANSRLLDLEHLSQHDKLTGLQNRGAFDDALTVMLNTANLRNGLTVYLIDLDNFKPINDSYSHLAGDTVLVAVAESLKRVAGPDAIVSRLGGDEFAVAVPNIPSDAASHGLITLNKAQASFAPMRTKPCFMPKQTPKNRWSCSMHPTFLPAIRLKIAMRYRMQFMKSKSGLSTSQKCLFRRVRLSALKPSPDGNIQAEVFWRLWISCNL